MEDNSFDRMHFEEHISKLKQLFPAADFRIPFSDASSILQRIERKFIMVRDARFDLNHLSQYHSQWAGHIKHKKKLRTVRLSDASWIAALDSGSNYWLVVSQSRYPQVKHLVFDCRPGAIAAIVAITRDDFFIVEKKYRWFAFFKVGEDKDSVTIFSGGASATPFGPSKQTTCN